MYKYVYRGPVYSFGRMITDCWVGETYAVTMKKARRDDRYGDDRYYQPERSDFKNVKFKSRGDAERILTKMEDIIYKNRFVSLLDFYDLTGQPTRSTDDNYGWTNLDRAKVERLRSDNGYIIRFPSPMPLDREYD